MNYDRTLAVQERVADLVSRMTLEEKISQMGFEAPAIERLGIPAYNWWNECLHGVGRAGVATVFPQAIGLAATWNPDLLYRVATATSDEARAKHHEALRRDIHRHYSGLTHWTPNVNIFRDPRWGRGQETYGEDPFLTARLGVAFVRGMQGDDPDYLKLVATPKHFAVHSGPESGRHAFDVYPGERDVRETYLPAFEACIREGGAASIMGAYNRLNGEPCCASPALLQKILREEWGFGGPDGVDGHIVSDCWAIRDIYAHHQVVKTPAEAAALAVKNGCDLNCGHTYGALLIAAVRNRSAWLLLPGAALLAQQVGVAVLNPAQDARYMMGSLMLAVLLLPLASVRPRDRATVADAVTTAAAAPAGSDGADATTGVREAPGDGC